MSIVFRRFPARLLSSKTGCCYWRDLWSRRCLTSEYYPCWLASKLFKVEKKVWYVDIYRVYAVYWEQSFNSINGNDVIVKFPSATILTAEFLLSSFQFVLDIIHTCTPFSLLFLLSLRSPEMSTLTVIPSWFHFMT